MRDLDSNHPPVLPLERAVRVGAVLLVAIWLVFCAFRPHLPVNPVSRLAGMEALVDHGTWAIDDTTLGRNTVDKVFWEGHYYSSKPPLLIGVGALVYRGVQQATGLTFREDAYQTAAWIRLFVGVLPWMLGLLALGHVLDRTMRSPRTRVAVTLAAALGSVATAYASDIANHGLSWAALVVSAALLVPLLRPGVRIGAARLGVAGITLGLAFTLDMGAGPTIGLVTFLVAVELLRRRLFVGAVLLCVGTLVFPAVQVGLQWQIAGTPMPFYMRPEAYDYPGSYWNNPVEFDALAEPKWVYALHCLIGHHGVFLTTPFLLIGATYLLRARETATVDPRLERVISASLAFTLVGYALRARLGVGEWIGAVTIAPAVALLGWHVWTDRTPRAEILRWTAIVTVVFTWIFYVFKMGNYGGRSVGMRWWIPTDPTLLFATARGIDRWELARRRPLLLGALIGAAAVSALGGAVNAWEEGFVYVLFQTLGLASVEG